MSQIYCSNCGQLIANTSNFCTYCGAPQHGKGASAFRVNEPTINDPLKVEQLAHDAQNHITHKHHIAQNTNNKVGLQKQNEDHHMPKQNLGTDAILYFIVTYWSKTFLMFVLILIGVFLLPGIFIFAMIAYIFSIIMTALLVHNNYHFEINASGLIVETGILHKHTVSVPFEQVQNVNIERTILDRILGFSRVSIETAGASVAGAVAGTKPKAEAYIPAVHLQKAKLIHDILLDGADGAIDGTYEKI